MEQNTHVEIIAEGPWGRRVHVVDSEGDVNERIELTRDLPRRATKQLTHRMEVLRKLDHASIHAPIAIEETSRGLTLVFPELPGDPLIDAIDPGNVSWSRAMRVGEAVCEALEAVHRHGLVHGEMVLEDLHVGPAGSLTLAGFERHLVLDALDQPIAGRRAERIAPEVQAGAAPSVQSDLFHLGVAMHELLTGAPPRVNASGDRVLALSSRERTTLPEGLGALLRQLLDASPSARPASAEAVRQEIGAILERHPDITPKPEDAQLQAYVERVLALTAERSSRIEPEELQGIAREMGLSESDLVAVAQAAEDYYQRGHGYLKHELWDDAVSELTEAFALDPARPDACFALAQAYKGRFVADADSSDRREAMQLCRRTVELDPGHDEAYAMLRELTDLEPEAPAPPAKPSRAVTRRRTAPSWGTLGLSAGTAFFVTLALLFLWNPAASKQAEANSEPPPTVTTPPVSPPLDPVVVPSDGSTRVTPDGALQRRIPAGTFLAGSDKHAVHLPDYFIDETEVTVASFRRCVQAGVCTSRHFTAHSTVDPVCNYNPSGSDTLPMNCVSYEGALQFVAWRSQTDPATHYRLPTHDEWEKAARGTDGRAFPWGAERPSCTSAQIGSCGFDRAVAVGSFPTDASPFAIRDMAGNLSEWVQAEPGRKHGGLRGGRFNAQPAPRLYERGTAPLPLGDVGHHAFDIGFRTVGF